MQEPTRQKATVLREGFNYLEGFRWHDGEVWFSDIPQDKVYRMSADGEELTVAAHDNIHPSGLGFPTDRNPFVVGFGDNTLREILPDGTTELIADLNDVAIGANDMWATPEGRAYVSQIGFDLSETPVPSRMVIVEPDGTVTTGGEGVVCPNGVQLTKDSQTLIVAESFAFRLSAFDVEEDGSLTNKRVIKQFEEGEVLDGLVLDEEDAIWVTMPFNGVVQRVTQEGEVTDIVEVAESGHKPVSCTLGGEDQRTLFIASADTEMETLFEGTARVEVAEVTIPGVTR